MTMDEAEAVVNQVDVAVAIHAPKHCPLATLHYNRVGTVKTEIPGQATGKTACRAGHHIGYSYRQWRL
jgi:hypothetical protein